ncbi:hypothetical protein EHQ12_06725 [Leptospira gomenensis]|uniref:Uncharacterized protein n=1 Tax=Leptospira gomenensis TaxID=2484974 RepID=A0A5F1Z1F8_9LEPT|nr:hypothetical protein [Leptospira gomenensis]TGK33429.1 hypothetical protein EHQ17_11620 [Leptospira gomenensis]TGK40951.1 hypothetical protein EHQ12_06725 [Leptospira gomenensis]TGK46379.1 hypothetical protein EHQ07_06055 [Leptospira gomenensis]TGK67485.1 hypothetical protein EHQ13_02225 [Leptospira gomenensis]
MPNPRSKIPQSLAQEFIKTIRLLALSGKKNFRKYLIEPLTYAGWEREKSHSTQSAAKIIDKIQSDSQDPAYVHTIGLNCKRLVSYALGENLSAVGDSCIFFLEKIQERDAVAESPEAADFFSVIEKPLSEFRELNRTKSERLFEDSIKNFSPEELKNALEPVKLDTHRQKVHLDGEVHRLYNMILTATKSDDLPKCKKLLSSYIIKFSDSENYNGQEAENLVKALEKRDAHFRENLRESLAIELYYLITKGILEGNVRKAIQGIRKYAHIFEGDPNARYYYEIDGLERKLYGIIREKDMMKDIKKGI